MNILVCKFIKAQQRAIKMGTGSQEKLRVEVEASVQGRDLRTRQTGGREGASHEAGTGAWPGAAGGAGRRVWECAHKIPRICRPAASSGKGTAARGAAEVLRGGQTELHMQQAVEGKGERFREDSTGEG